MIKLLILIFALISCSQFKIKGPSLDKELKMLEAKRVEYNKMPSQINPEQGFMEKSKEYGLAGLSASSISVVDLNGDFYSDLVIIKDYFSYPEVYLFSIEDNKFKKSDGFFKNKFKASSIIFAHLNDDKIIDAIATVLNQKSEITKEPIKIFMGKKENGRIVFHKQKEKFPMPPMATSSIGLIDFDLDGDLDLYIGNWLAKEKNQNIAQRDFLLENNSGVFSDISERIIDEHKQTVSKTMYVNAVATYGVQICDMDQNGFPDILAIASNGFKNKLWMNEYALRKNKRQFNDYGVVSKFAGDNEGSLNINGGGRTFSLACGDYNHDQIMDVFLGELSHSYDQEGMDKSSILTGATFNFPPKYYRTEYFEDSYDISWNQADRRGVWFDYNNDGLLDLLVDNSGFPPHTRLIMFKQFEDHSFVSVAKDIGIDFSNPQTSVILDLNKDGKMDIISAQSNLRDASIKPRLFVFENNIMNKNKSIRFYLRGENSNFDGINASVALKLKSFDGNIAYKTMPVSYSYGAFNPQNEKGIHFGLKENEQLLGVRVIWPYSKRSNINRAGLEKYYDLSDINMQKTISITLCEKGSYLIGRKYCN